MRPEKIRLLLLTMCVLFALLPVATASAENNLLIQVQDGVMYYSADGGQNWVKGVPEGAQVSIIIPQQTLSAQAPAQMPNFAVQTAAPQSITTQAPMAGVQVQTTTTVQPAPGLPQAGATFSFANAQGVYAMMASQPCCCCCCCRQRGALNAYSQSATNTNVAAVPETNAGAQSETAPAQAAATQDNAQPQQNNSVNNVPTSDQSINSASSQSAMGQSAVDPSTTETQPFIAPAPILPDQNTQPGATEEPAFSAQMSGTEDFEPMQGMQASSAQQPQQYVTVEPSQAVQIQPSDSEQLQNPQSVPTQTPAEQQAQQVQPTQTPQVQQSMIANQTEVLLGTAANGATVWVWHDVNGNPIYSTDNGLSWSNNEPEGLVIAPMQSQTSGDAHGSGQQTEAELNQPALVF